MSYVYIIAAAVMFSFVGTLVKAASRFAPAVGVSFSRFFFGLIFLLIICLIRRKKPRLYYKNRWIFIAAAGKIVNYLCENIALRSGASYGNIVVYPVQAVSLCLFSVFFFQEKLGPRKIIATCLCLTGMLTVSLNGADLSALLKNSLSSVLLFSLAAVGAALFILSQKKLMEKVDPVNMNLSVFLLGALGTGLPTLAAAGDFQNFSFTALGGLVGLGIITGGAFLLVARSLKNMSLLVNGMIQNASVLFTLLWGVLLWHETIPVSTIVGCVIFIFGLIFINIKPKKGIFVN